MAQLRDDVERLLGPGRRIGGDEASGPIVEIDRDGHRGRISLFGGQILDWQPAGHDPVLWLSDDAVFDQRTPIRGGIPVCWPWFGNDMLAGHETHNDRPMHGFARANAWSFESVDEAAVDEPCYLWLPIPENASAYWPHETRPSAAFQLGEKLEIELTTPGIDADAIEFTEALHTYFAVGDIEQVSISGLEASTYIDKLTGQECPANGAPITISSETDRIYRQLTGPIEIYDAVLKRTITIEHSGATNAIVWNPWVEKSARLGDMGGPGAYRGMVCIETGNVAPDAVTLESGDMHVLKTTISVRKDT